MADDSNDVVHRQALLCCPEQELCLAKQELLQKLELLPARTASHGADEKAPLDLRFAY